MRKAQAGTRPESAADERGARSPLRFAALIAMLAFAWGQSLLVFDWARRALFDPEGQGHLALSLPFFGLAALAGVTALSWRRGGERPAGGALVHALGLTSGLLGVVGLVMFLWLGPWARGESQSLQGRRVRQQLELLAGGLAAHRMEHGTYPIGFGLETLHSALAPEFIPTETQLLDPWGRPLHYQSLSLGHDYLLLSSGPDGQKDLSEDGYQEPGLRLKDDHGLLSGRWLRPGVAAASSPETGGPR